VTDIDLAAIKAEYDAAKEHEEDAAGWYYLGEHVPALLARIAELEAERDEARDGIRHLLQREQELLRRETAALGTGYERAAVELRAIVKTALDAAKGDA